MEYIKKGRWFLDHNAFYLIRFSAIMDVKMPNGKSTRNFSDPSGLDEVEKLFGRNALYIKLMERL